MIDEEIFKPSVVARGLLVIDELQRKEILDKGVDILEDDLYLKAKDVLFSPLSGAHEHIRKAAMAPMRSLVVTMNPNSIGANIEHIGDKGFQISMMKDAINKTISNTPSIDEVLSPLLIRKDAIETQYHAMRNNEIKKQLYKVNAEIEALKSSAREKEEKFKKALQHLDWDETVAQCLLEALCIIKKKQNE